MNIMKFPLSAAIAIAAIDCSSGLVPIVLPVHAEVRQTLMPGSSILLSGSETKPASSITVDNLMLKSLEDETKAAEQEAKVDRRRAALERKREAFFEYEARAATEKEAQIEAAEQKALAEAQKDKAQAERLRAMEEKVEREAATALSRKERVEKQKEARVRGRRHIVWILLVFYARCEVQEANLLEPKKYIFSYDNRDCWRQKRRWNERRKRLKNLKEYSLPKKYRNERF